jgi:hypothetical protein
MKVVNPLEVSPASKVKGMCWRIVQKLALMKKAFQA